jgi:CheY-like chemotaxis protein
MPRSQPTKTILIVDDDPTQLDLLELILAEEHCYRLLRARSGRQALCVVAETPEPPDLFVVDYSMPGMDGLELYDHLHAQAGCEHIPGIMVSSSLPPREELEKRALVGVQKPYDIDQLTRRIEAVISTAHKTLV